MNALAQRTLDISATQEGVREHGHNRGPEIDGYCRDIGHDPAKGDPWCSIFVCAMFKRAADQLGVPVPFHMTAGVFTLEEQFPSIGKFTTPLAGDIFILNGHRHTGLVVGVKDYPEGQEPPLGDREALTREGNTDPVGSAEGDGVYLRTRKFSEILVYLRVSALDAPLVA